MIYSWFFFSSFVPIVDPLAFYFTGTSLIFASRTVIPHLESHTMVEQLKYVTQHGYIYITRDLHLP